nr:MAG TPA: hypothetical protein [Bacteriophage sp.]
MKSFIWFYSIVFFFFSFPLYPLFYYYLSSGKIKNFTFYFKTFYYFNKFLFLIFLREK